MAQSLRIDNLQYANWSEKIFRQMREGGVHGVHVTISYHENFRETVLNIEAWNRWFEQFPDLIFMGRTAEDVRTAQKTNRTAIFFGFQNPSPIEDDIGLIEICHTLGARFMQLSYNNQSLLATGCYEAEDPGITRFGKQAIAEMNRVGLVGTACTLESFCEMIAETGAKYGAQNLGIGTDLCQDQPDSVVTWMRNGMDYGEGSAANAGFPPMPTWFEDNRHFDNIQEGLLKTGLSTQEVEGIMGENWLRFYEQNFGPQK